MDDKIESVQKDDIETRFKIRGIEDVKAVNFDRTCSCNGENEACSDCRYEPMLELTRPDRQSIVIPLSEGQVELIERHFQVLNYPYK